MNFSLSYKSLKKSSVQGRRDRQQKLIARTQPGRGIQNFRQVHANFFHSATRHDRDPRLGRIEHVLRGIGSAVDRRAGKIGERMADETRIHSAIAIELFFKRKYHQRLRDILSQKANTSLPPRPELRAHVVHNGNAALAHLPRHTPVESRRVDHNGQIGLAPACLRDQLVKQSPDFR